jgi:hypothetical protein
MPNKPWKEWTDTELADEAQQGVRGQGAVIEMMRRLRDSNKGLTCANVALTLVALALTAVQLFRHC